jgi:hypothetical protein
MEAKGVQMFGGNEVQAVVGVSLTDVGPKVGSILVGVTLPSCWTGPRAEGAFYGWCAGDQS